MPSPGELTKVIASATGIAQPTVAQVMREQRAAGLITTGVRGVNAPPMTPADAANVLTAMLVSERPVDAVRALRDCGHFKFIKVSYSDDWQLAFKGIAGEVFDNNFSAHTFIDDLAFILNKLPTCEKDNSSFVEISFDTEKFFFEVNTFYGIAVYASPEWLEVVQGSVDTKNNRASTAEKVRRIEAVRNSYQNSRLSVRRTVHHATLFEIAKAFAEA